jgi:hypothetical protein
MTCSEKYSESFALVSKHRLSWLAMASVLALAWLLRSHQFLEQVLVDDEWHAVHQIIFSDVKTIVTSFGLADYSIPLTLYDQALASTIGLSELGMRAPMFIAGLALIVVWMRWVRQRFGLHTAFIVGLLMAVSPLLFYYSRIARPYGLTILLIPLTLWSYLQWWHCKRSRYFVLNAVLVVLSSWLHLLTVPFVLAPQLWALTQLRTRSQALLWLRQALAVGLGLLLVVGPPFLLNPRALGDKVAADLPTVATIGGALHQWVGSDNIVVVCVVLALAGIGLPRVWRHSGELGRVYALGLGLTFLAVGVMRPAWVNNAITFARYALPIVPVLLVCCTVGVFVVAERLGVGPAVSTGVALLAIAAGYGLTSPLPQFFEGPRSYTAHYYYHFDVRAAHNPVRPFLQAFPATTAWSQLAPSRVGQVTIALAPWDLESFWAEHPLWELQAHQRVIPASAQGLCTAWQGGHPHPERGIALRNFVSLADPQELKMKRVDFIALRKPLVFSYKACYAPRHDLTRCIDDLRQRYGEPYFEDENTVIFDIRAGKQL